MGNNSRREEQKAKNIKAKIGQKSNTAQQKRNKAQQKRNTAQQKRNRAQQKRNTAYLLGEVSAVLAVSVRTHGAPDRDMEGDGGGSKRSVKRRRRGNGLSIIAD